MDNSQKNKVSGRLNGIGKFIMRPVDASSLGIFRFIFGMLMVWSTLKYFYSGWIKDSYIDQNFLFTYEWFPWISPLPGDGMYYIFGVMAASAFFLALGFLYRVSAIVFFLTYTYVFLIDKSLYNNHYYFICLLAFLFCFINAHRWMSIDLLWNKKLRSDIYAGSISNWNVLIMKAQVFVVYFFGGVAKINSDWLKGQPLKGWLKNSAEREAPPEIITQFLTSDFAAYFFSYGGLLFDLAIGFILIYKKTRWLGIILILIFNFSNSWLFIIGVFPYLMIGATILFLEPETPRNCIQRIFPKLEKNATRNVLPQMPYRTFAMTFVFIYLFIQIFLPIMHFLYQGNASWTEEGHHFAWRMKLRSKNFCALVYEVTNLDTREKWPIFPDKLIPKHQFGNMCRRPHMILQFAYHLKTLLQEQGPINPAIKARTLVAYNYRPPQTMIDPEVNLLEKNYSTFQHADWIVPLKN
ncbi:MAG: HTTM domain-containing protein [Nitrospinales bacterium]